MESGLLPQITKYLEERKTEQPLQLPNLEQLSSELRECARQIIELTGTWNPVEIYSATNIGAERLRFMGSLDTQEVYNPQFTYDVADKDIPGARVALVELRQRLKVAYHAATDELERQSALALLLKIKDDEATCGLIDGLASGDEKKVGDSLLAKYGKMSPTLVVAVQGRLERMIAGGDEKKIEGITPLLSDEEQKALKELPIFAADTKAAFEWALNELGILATDENPDGFVVVIDPKANGIDVRDKSRNGRPTVFVPTDESRQGKQLDGASLLSLMEHEIRGHARQSMNGYALFGVGGGPLKIDDESLYEGLAKRYDTAFHRDFYGTSAGEPLPFHILAIHDAEKGLSFREVFDAQYEYRLRIELKIPLDQPLPATIDEKIIKDARVAAWNTAYRAFRGHLDTTNTAAYANGKDAAYFQGWLLDNQLVALGHGHMNDAAIMAPGGLRMLGRFNVQPESLPFPDKPVALPYWEQVLKPKLQSLPSSALPQ